ncbi:MAG: 4-(cytidine 5'-diphospho)-2-C-methyl-D-erythritol kinase [Ignavibacteria bacterium]|nr:4-(cytidine 5'-diphospho)-2-C-methyl-D-erythritol kinase [Ignavibacteria bacterium]
MTLLAHAKINLGLHILRRRDDGYHDIETVFHRVGIADEIAFTKKERGVRFTCDDPAMPVDEGNLCVRAAIALFEATGYDGGIGIDLRKRIPAGAGLGGGSADAAAVLRAAIALLDISIAEDDLHGIAAELGSDVPYFLHPGSAHATGRGELLSYFVLRLPYWIVVVYPGVHVSTPWAYGQFRPDVSLPIRNLRELLLTHIDDPVTLVNTLRNDFEPIVFRAHEDVMRAKEILYRTGADFALMSGSGSSVFGLFRDETYARESAAFFAKTWPAFLTPPYFTPA